MIKPAYAARMIFGSTRGLRLFVANLLAGFGLTSAAVQFVGQLFPKTITRPGIVTISTSVLCIAWGVVRASPRQRIHRRFQQPDMNLTVAVGDLFDQDCHTVVGFSDTFDTSIAADRVISHSSVQGQLLARRYGGNRRLLDRELSNALRNVPPVGEETRAAKPRGKLRRYPIGTVALLGSRERLVVGLAYSHMGNNLIARSSADDLWLSLSALWEAIDAHSQHRAIAMPLVGAGLARIGTLEPQSLLRMIMLSFVARSRRAPVCRELRIIIWPPDVEKLDMLEAAAFLRSL